MARPLKSARISRSRARRSGELGAWVRLHYVYPYPHVDDVIPLMAEGKILPYLDIPFQHALPRVLKAHAPAGEPGEDARSDRRLGARSAPISPSAAPSSSAFPARPRRISSSCSTGCRKPSSIASAASSMSRSTARRPMRLPARCPRRSRKSAGTLHGGAAGDQRATCFAAKSAARST